LKQRVQALNRFLHDIYHGQEILKAGKVPAEQVNHNAQFRREMIGVDVPGGVYAHIAGVDIVRHSDGEYYVLEDNLRTPSGVSYMLENRKMMMRLFPELFANQTIRRSTITRPAARDPARRGAPQRGQPDHRPAHAGPLQQRLLRARVPRAADGHRARGGRGPLRRQQHRLHAHHAGPAEGRRDLPAHRRRLSSTRSRSVPTRCWACPDCLAAYAPGASRLANAIGTGVADDKSMYPYVPEMIRFYLGRGAALLNNVPTYLLRDPEDRAYVLDHPTSWW
jgi:uncharacterized circularly permuted ATP-grasp superfamily protein